MGVPGAFREFEGFSGSVSGSVWGASGMQQGFKWYLGRFRRSQGSFKGFQINFRRSMDVSGVFR